MSSKIKATLGSNHRAAPQPAQRATITTTRRRAIQAALGLGGSALSACDPFLYKYPPPPAALGTFPYNPLVFHLDLSILAYQLHGQSLVWPIDPFYEERTKGNGVDRPTFMARVAQWAQELGPLQTQSNSGASVYRGPGVLGGFANNPSHDPILYNYSRIHPWSPAIMNAAGRWTEYLTPSAITAPIAAAYVSYRIADSSEDSVDLREVSRHPDAAPADTSRDMLIAFEGGTGDKGEVGQPASQSLMGFVLMRRTGDESYDIHIAFRGSRSGKASRAALDSLNTGYAGGNPDWITDFGWNPISAADTGGHITTTGSVSRGFARSIEITMPAISEALAKLAVQAGNAPDNIYVTGHSLGGALAQHFTSAILLGNRYGPKGQGPAMPAELKTWPWNNIKLITYGSPRAGDVQWAHALTKQAMQSDFFEAPLSPYDTSARYVTDPEIIERLKDPASPVAYRVLISTDAITTEKISGGAHVGKTVYVNGDLLTGWFGLPSFGAHEPENIRQYMTDAMADPRTPADAWNYHPLKAFAPDRNEDRAGSQEEFAKLGQAVLNYYKDRQLWFDAEAFTYDMQLLLDFG